MTKKNEVTTEATESPDAIFTTYGGMVNGVYTRGGVSATIRKLAAEGKSTGTIAKMLGKRYQHVRNVLKEPLKK